MAIRPPTPGVQSVPEYQVSGTPWVTGSLAVDGLVKIAFPSVTKFFIVSPASGDVSFGFTEEGVSSGEHSFSIASTDPPVEINIKCRDLWLSGAGINVDILAGLTSIPRYNYPHLTGANPAPTGSQYLPGV